MKTKPKLSFWQIWNMSFGFFGIQFGFALQNANVSRIFESLGANVEDIPILWIAAPVTGLIIQPIIGHMSDNTWNRLGRRRPFFLTGAILASIALLIMPNSPVLWVAAGMLWIMDASINVSMEPFRAFVGDMLSSKQRTSGFAMQSFFIGTGAVIASALPYVMTNWFGVSTTPLEGQSIPPNVKWSFYAGAAVFITAVLVTVIKTREYSPEELRAFEEAEVAEKKDGQTGPVEQILKIPTFLRAGFIWMISGAILSALFFWLKVEGQLYILSFGLFAFGLILLVTHLVKASGAEKSGLVEVMTDLFNMPKTMMQLAVVQFFSWFALFAMWIYTTAGVTSHIYGTSDTSSALYNEGANWVGILFAVYNGFAALVAFGLPVLAKYTNRRVTHMIALIAGGVGLISVYFIGDPKMLVIPMFGVGLAWASILAMPYAILTGSLPGNKMGTYMGIFNFFIVIPQIMAASILGFMVKSVFGGQPIFALIAGGISMLLASVLVLLVKDVDEEK
jgi:maltose/moltooligosaccharide transporter